MPALIFLGRRWNIGSDDFVISSVIDLFIRVIWLVVMVVILFRNDNTQCNEEETILLGFLGINHACIISDILLMQSSRRGSIMETSKRKFVPHFLSFKVIVECVNVIWTLLCTLDTTSDQNLEECLEITETSSGLVIFNWIILCIHLIILSYCFDPLGASDSLFLPENSPESGENARGKVFSSINIPLPVTKYGKSWKRRCKLYCCAFRKDMRKSEDSKVAIAEIAKIFGAVGKGENLTNSDVAAGLMLLSYQTRTLAPNPESKPYQDAAGSNLDGWTSLANIYHYTQYACAPFGWFTVMMNDDKSLISMAKYFINNACCSKCKAPEIRSTKKFNCCSLDLAGLQENLNGKIDNILFASFANKPFEVPFLIILDHSTKSVIISIRGSLSMNDFLVDFAAWPTQIPGYSASFKAHHGILSASLSLKQKIDLLQILPNTFLKFPNYKLVLTGHSLGSGCATILALLYNSEYIGVKCYSYGAPGALLSKDAAEFCNGFVTSIVFCDDLIARLGIAQIIKLKHRLKNALKDCVEPKYAILLKRLIYSNPNYKIKQLSGSNSVSGPGDSYNCENKVDHNVTAVEDEIKSEFGGFEDTYLPGRIFYITRKEDNGTNFTWRWAERTEFQDILVSNKMIWDHMPNKIPYALRKIIRKDDLEQIVVE